MKATVLAAPATGTSVTGSQAGYVYGVAILANA